MKKIEKKTSNIIFFEMLYLFDTKKKFKEREREKNQDIVSS